MIYRSKAPLRIGLAGGGTDVSPYSDQFGGAILNATISLSAYAAIETLPENKIIVEDTLVVGKVTAVRNANGRDWWLLANEYKKNSFYMNKFFSQK